MRKVLLLAVLSILLVFSFAANAFAIVEVYSQYGPEPDYPSVFYFGPTTLNAYAYSDTSDIKSVSFTVYQSNNDNPILSADAVNTKTIYNDGNWAADLGNRDWVPGDYRVDVFAENGVGETAFRSGYFRIEGGSILFGTVSNWANSPIKWTTLYFHEPGQDPWTGTYSAVDESGRFAVTGLVSGTKTVSMYVDGQLIQVGTVTVNVDASGVTASSSTGSISVDDSGKLAIVLPKPSVSGRLVRNGELLSDAYVTIQKAGSLYEYYWTMTDKYGNFGLNLADGEYIIKEVNTAKEYNYLRVILDKTFTVSGTVDLGDISVPGANVSGMISGIKASNYTSAYNYGVSMSFIKKGVEDNGYDSEYFWTNAPYDCAAEQYKFELFLPEGTYSLQAYSMNGIVDSFGETFTVTGADGNYSLSANEGNKIITVENGQMKITIPSDNVTGTLRDTNNNPLSYASLLIKPADAVEYDWTKYKWLMTDENGNFSLYLLDGNYVATDIYYQGVMGTQSYEFTVTNSAQLDLTLVP